MGERAESQWEPSALSVPIKPELTEQCVKSGARVVSVLEYFRHLGRPSRAVEIGRALGLAPSSTSDLLKTLVEVGYLDFDESEKTYFPGLRAALFGQWLTDFYPNLGALSELTHKLCTETGESVVLFVQRFHQVQIVAVRQGCAPPPNNVVEGASLPVFGTAAGGAVLMVKSHGELCRIAKRTFRRKTCSKTVAAMSEMVRSFKEQGYASSLRDDVIPGNWAIALPVPVRSGLGTIVMGVGGPIERVRINERNLAGLARDRISHYFH